MTFRISSEGPPLKMSAEGVLLVSGTRMTLDSLVEAFDEGATAEEIARQYPSVPLADVYVVIGYVLKHRPDVDRYLEQRRQRRSDVQKQNESRWPQTGIRRRMLARREGR